MTHRAVYFLHIHTRESIKRYYYKDIIIYHQYETSPVFHVFTMRRCNLLCLESSCLVCFPLPVSDFHQVDDFDDESDTFSVRFIRVGGERVEQ